MDITDAKRNLAIYRHNIIALQQIDLSVLKYAEKELVGGMIRRFKELEKNIEQAIFKKT